MRWLVALLAAAAALVAAAGCGHTTAYREPPTIVGGHRPERTSDREPRLRGDAAAVRIAVVTHGNASSDFWTIVRNGAEAAGRQVDAQVTYRSPDSYSPARMAELVDEAATGGPDGLVVSVPDAQVAAAVRRAVRLGIPTVSINAGGALRRSLGVLTHVGQPEQRAGREAGRRLAAAGVRRALCVVHEAGNAALEERCRGLAAAMRRSGGSSATVVIDAQDRRAARVVAAAIRARRADGVLGLGMEGTLAALDARVRAGVPQAPVGGFDLAPEVLGALREGRLLFTIDQQAYLQGHLPVVLLTQRARYGLFPGAGDTLATGPHVVTREDAEDVLELSRQLIR